MILTVFILYLTLFTLLVIVSQVAVATASQLDSLVRSASLHDEILTTLDALETDVDGFDLLTPEFEAETSSLWLHSPPAAALQSMDDATPADIDTPDTDAYTDTVRDDIDDNDNDDSAENFPEINTFSDNADMQHTQHNQQLSDDSDDEIAQVEFKTRNSHSPIHRQSFKNITDHSKAQINSGRDDEFAYIRPYYEANNALVKQQQLLSALYTSNSQHRQPDTITIYPAPINTPNYNNQPSLLSNSQTSFNLPSSIYHPSSAASSASPNNQITTLKPDIQPQLSFSTQSSTAQFNNADVSESLSTSTLQLTQTTTTAASNSASTGEESVYWYERSFRVIGLSAPIYVWLIVVSVVLLVLLLCFCCCVQRHRESYVKSTYLKSLKELRNSRGHREQDEAMNEEQHRQSILESINVEPVWPQRHAPMRTIPPRQSNQHNRTVAQITQQGDTHRDRVTEPASLEASPQSCTNTRH